MKAIGITMNRYLAELEIELEKKSKAPPKGTAKTVKRAFGSKDSTKVGPFSEKKLPSWCSATCPALIELHTPQGKLSGCRQEFADQISWVRLSFLKGCPEEIGQAAMNDKGWPEW